jgi:hypothetical protein
MSTTNTRLQSASIRRQSGTCDCRASSGVRVGCILLAIGAYFCFGPKLLAQTSDSRTPEGPNQSWTATTDVKSNNVNPTRIIESHSQVGNLTVEGQSLQGRGVDGNFEVFQDVETETLQVDANTVRTTTRMFGRGADGRKSLVRVTEEDKHTLPSGDSNVLRITSNLDLNGRLQPFQREIVETKKIGEVVEETNTTVMIPSVNGGFAPSIKTHGLRKEGANETVESQKTTLVPDGAGNWQVSEIRQNTARQEADTRLSEERVSRRDAEGKLVEASRSVSKETQGTSGDKRSVVESYSVDVPGAPRDGNLHLVERARTAQRTSPTGEQITENKVERLNPGDPSAGLRISIVVNDTVLPGPSGEQATRTIRMRDGNGNFGVVSVDTTKSDRVPTIQIQQTPSETPK